ncbi:hypothetical protein C1H46_015662 [Malus baccata]|uniref:Uncharacterized protein n=1 Tax=Malus baccata TaxID=106549 RepID=A0A540MIY9_MALBA|nr:hypothetical protein C1H46_015662 [Malus baccata]
MAATSSTAIVPQILDVKRDYKDWRVRVKTYLLSKDLWDVVETTSEPPEQEGVSDFKGKKNSEALHAIQLSCGPRTFPLIRDKTRAKAAWDTLEALFNREKSNLLSMAAEYDQEEKPDEILRRDYQPFFAAVRRGNWLETKKFLDEHDHAQTVTDSLGTALHNAVIFGQVKIVEELVKLMTKEELKIQSSDGWTALAYAAREDLKMVTCMVTKSTELLRIPENGRQMTPILIAAMYERWDIVRYLFHQPDFPLKDLMPFKGPYGSQLLLSIRLANTFNNTHPTGDHWPPLQQPGPIPAVIQRINHIRQLKLTHVQSQEILDFMCDVIKHLNHEEMRDGLVYEAVYSAVQNGIVEVVTSICKARPELLFRGLEAGKSIFHYSVECRQEKVYELIYGVGKRNLIMTLRDDSFNGMLHYAGILSPSLKEKLDRIPGAALQMQKERQWYKVLNLMARKVEDLILSCSNLELLEIRTCPELDDRWKICSKSIRRRGYLHETKKFLTLHPNAIKGTDRWGTALHNATIFGHEQIVEELVQLMTGEDLEMKDTKDSNGWTALAYAAKDNIKMVECMVTKNKKLLGIPIESLQMTPILIAALHDRWNIVRYLYSFTPRSNAR